MATRSNGAANGPRVFTDKEGRKRVTVSLAQYRRLKRSYDREQLLLRIKRSILYGLQEIREIEAGTRQPKSLEEFVNEL